MSIFAKETKEEAVHGGYSKDDVGLIIYSLNNYNIYDKQLIKRDEVVNIPTNIAKKYGRPDKDNIYVRQQHEILDKLLKILGITATNKIFYCEDLDDNKKKQILDLSNDVKKYFKAGKWPVFNKEISEKNTYLSLTKSILKAMGKDIKYFSHRDSTITQRGFIVS
jgi:hypothetical protein